MKHKIKGDIISWNDTIFDFNNKLKTVKDDEDITLEINSYGGDVFLGIDLMNTLRSHEGNVTVVITGIAASAASVIAMGADKVKMFSNTQMMIHNAWTIAMGNSKQLRKVADDLETVGESVLASYTHRVDADTVKKLLDEESYMSASKALEYGFIDEIVDVKAEEVESELFSNKADEFNSKIKTNDNELASKVVSLEDEVLSLKQQLKEKEEPAQSVAAQRRGFFF